MLHSAIATFTCPRPLLQSTALKLLWEELRQMVDQHKGILEQLGPDALRLVSRVPNSLREDSMLVFDMDLSAIGGFSLA